MVERNTAGTERTEIERDHWKALYEDLIGKLPRCSCFGANTATHSRGVMYWCDECAGEGASNLELPWVAHVRRYRNGTTGVRD